MAQIPVLSPVHTRMHACTHTAIITRSYIYTFLLGGDDYVELSREILLSAGTRRMCVGVAILDDLRQEASENFEVVIEGTGASTSVVILDNGECLPVHGVQNVYQCMGIISLRSLVSSYTRCVVSVCCYSCTEVFEMK